MDSLFWFICRIWVRYVFSFYAFCKFLVNVILSKDFAKSFSELLDDLRLISKITQEMRIELINLGTGIFEELNYSLDEW